MHLLIVTQYFPPEVGAPQTRLYELARRLVARGHRVSVLAPVPSYPTGVVPAEYRGRILVRETMEGIRVWRTAVYATPNRGFLKRIAGHLSFTGAALLAWPLAGRPDAVLVESPPIFHGLVGAAISRLAGAAFLFNIADLWLESAIEMGVVRSRPLIRVTELFQRWIYRESTVITAVTRGIVARLRADGVPDEKLRLLTNGVDADLFRPTPDRDELRRQLGWTDRFVALYAGTHGLAHGLDVILEAAALLEGRPDILFVLAGEGADKERLRERAAHLQLSNVAFLPNQPKARMPGLLSAADACVVPLRDLPIFRGALPSKMFEAMATARPILLGVAGEAAELLAESGAGIALTPESASDLASETRRLADDAEGARAIGERGREWVKVHFSRERIAARFEEILREAIARRRQ